MNTFSLSAFRARRRSRITRSWTPRRLFGIPVAAVMVCGVVSVNVPTVGGTLGGWYHQYQMTRPAYEAKNGLWVKLNIPAKFRVNGIHSTLLYNGDVLIMAVRATTRPSSTRARSRPCCSTR